MKPQLPVSILIAFAALTAGPACLDAPLTYEAHTVYSPLYLRLPRGDSTFVYYYNRDDQNLYRKPLIGGTPELLVQGARLPAITPDGRRLAFRLVSGGLWVHNFDTDSTTLVAQGDIVGTTWMGDSLLYEEFGFGIWLATPEGGRRRLAATGRSPAASSGEACYVRYGRNNSSRDTTELRMLKDGLDSLLRVLPGDFRYPSPSPDGGRIAVYNSDEFAVQILDRVTLEFVVSISNAADPGYTADGRILYINFSNDERDHGQIWIADPDGTNQRQLTVWEDHH